MKKNIALKWHPDKNSSPEAPDNFRAVAQAFAVLSDIERRKQYDRSGGKDHGSSRDADDVDPHIVFEVLHSHHLILIS
jgi:molecular chaperone DnaJ